MPIDDFSVLIDNISKEYTILLVGKGDYYDKYINILTNKNINFANFINIQNIYPFTIPAKSFKVNMSFPAAAYISCEYFLLLPVLLYTMMMDICISAYEESTNGISKTDTCNRR